MDHTKSQKGWHDFHDFLSAKGEAVPTRVSKQILASIREKLLPSAWLVFAKLILIQSIFGSLSLAICDQFGLNPFNTAFSLSPYFMKLGHSTCMVLCGFLFISFSISSAFFLLHRDEIFVLKKRAILQIFTLTTLSLISLIAFGAEVVLAVAILWIAGGMMGGMLPLLIYKPRES